MKKILILGLSLILTCGCFEDYVVDYDYDAVYVAFQYDLRSFIVGEPLQFSFGAALSGVMSNDRERVISYSIDDNLLSADLSEFGGEASFTALDGMKGNGRCGVLSQGYVTTAVTAAGLTSLKPFPKNLYTLSDGSNIRIAKGNHTGTVTVTADKGKLLDDPHFGRHPYYAIGIKLNSADADTILRDRSFEIIALRAENMFFGDWYHGGKSHVEDASGNVVAGSENVYATKKPCDDNTFYKYTLTTDTPLSCTTSYFHNQAGSMTIGMDGENVTVSDPAGRITDMGSGWNNAKLLQERKIFLNYKYTNGDGTFTVVSDTLSFRARIHDGVNEWQDTNPEHYQ